MAKDKKGNKRKQKPSQKKAKRTRLTAATADKHDLYQRSVQAPEPDIHFIHRIFKRERGRVATHFREDFCGTALLTSYWVGRGKKFTAEGFDIDPEPLAWGRKHNLAPLGAAAKRAVLHQSDVRERSSRKPDVRCAQNFSWWVFKTRTEMLDYCTGVRRDLVKDGLFVMDIHGGPECMEKMQETTKIEGGFTYVWDQHFFSPVTHDAVNYIHFRFKDGSRLKRAFKYEWRLWTIPEIRDVLMDAGFSRVDVYWEGTSDDGETGNGIYRKTRLGTNDPSFVAYVIGVK